MNLVSLCFSLLGSYWYILILKNVHKDILLFKKQAKLLKFWVQILTAGLEIKNILRSPFGDQLEKYSRQMQTFSHQSV